MSSVEEAKEDITEERKRYFNITITIHKGFFNFMKKILSIFFTLALAVTFAEAQSLQKAADNPAFSLSGVLTSDVTDTTSTSVIAAQGAKIRTYIDAACAQNSHSTQGTWINFLNGSTVKWSCYAAVLGGGCCVPIKTPLRGDANTAWSIQAVTSGASIRASMSGFKQYEQE